MDKQLDKRVRTILYYIMGIIGNFNGYGNYVLITDVYRTDPEQIKIYGGEMPKSGNIHGCWRALDFVVKNAVNDNWNNADCVILLGEINRNIQYHTKDRFQTCVFHSVQAGDKGHFHLQVSWKNQTLIRR